MSSNFEANGIRPGEPNAITADMIQNSAVTDAKLANPKVNRDGDTMTAPLIFSDPNNQSKVILAKYPTGSSHNNAPTAFDLTSVYLHLGGVEYNTNSYRLIGFGYRRHGDTSHAAAVMGYQETSGSGEDAGRLLFATRNVTTDTAPTIRMTIEPNGQILIEAGYVPATDNAVPNKKYVDDSVSPKLTGTQMPAQADLAGGATLAEVITAHNALLAEFRTAGLMAT